MSRQPAFVRRAGSARTRRSALLRAAALGLGLLGAGAASAQTASTPASPAPGPAPAPAPGPAWPSRVVTIIVPFAAGGTTDLLGRLLAEKLGARTGGSFIVENRAGAGGNIGVAAVARATPDGHTLAMGTVSTHAINPNVYRSIPYDHVRDFAPISLVASVPNLLLVNPNVPAKTVKELVDLLKARPGQFVFASSGVGTSTHLAGELFKLSAGVDISHVPYRSSSQVTQDLLAGSIQMTFDNITVAWPHVEAGRLRALGTATPERLPFAKDLPTLGETFPGFAATSWHGLFAPAGTPEPVLARLSTEVMAILREPATIEALAKVGVTPVGSTRAEFASHIERETARWKEVAARANIRID